MHLNCLPPLAPHLCVMLASFPKAYELSLAVGGIRVMGGDPHQRCECCTVQLRCSGWLPIKEGELRQRDADMRGLRVRRQDAARRRKGCLQGYACASAVIVGQQHAPEHELPMRDLQVWAGVQALEHRQALVRRCPSGHRAALSRVEECQLPKQTGYCQACCTTGPLIQLLRLGEAHARPRPLAPGKVDHSQVQEHLGHALVGHLHGRFAINTENGGGTIEGALEPCLGGRILAPSEVGGADELVGCNEGRLPLIGPQPCEDGNREAQEVLCPPVLAPVECEPAEVADASPNILVQQRASCAADRQRLAQQRFGPIVVAGEDKEETGVTQGEPGC